MGLPDVALRQGLTHGNESAKLYPSIGGAGLVEESDAAGIGVGVGGVAPGASGAALLHDHLGARQVSRLPVGNNDGRDLGHSGNWGGRGCVSSSWEGIPTTNATVTAARHPPTMAMTSKGLGACRWA
jgi:hypothetical protein